MSAFVAPEAIHQPNTNAFNSERTRLRGCSYFEREPGADDEPDWTPVEWTAVGVFGNHRPVVSDFASSGYPAEHVSHVRLTGHRWEPTLVWSREGVPAKKGPLGWAP